MMKVGIRKDRFTALVWHVTFKRVQGKDLLTTRSVHAAPLYPHCSIKPLANRLVRIPFPFPYNLLLTAPHMATHHEALDGITLLPGREIIHPQTALQPSSHLINIVLDAPGDCRARELQQKGNGA